MSNLATFFVAREEVATSFAPKGSVAMAYWECRGVLDLDCELLWEALDGGRHSEGENGLEEIKQTESEWVFRFPSDLTSRLANLPDDQIPVVARRWSEQPECAGSKVETLATLIEELRYLATRSSAEGLSLYLWGCL